MFHHWSDYLRSDVRRAILVAVDTRTVRRWRIMQAVGAQRFIRQARIDAAGWTNDARALCAATEGSAASGDRIHRRILAARNRSAP